MILETGGQPVVSLTTFTLMQKGLSSMQVTGKGKCGSEDRDKTRAAVTTLQ